jgi:hypothetical protein
MHFFSRFTSAAEGHAILIQHLTPADWEKKLEHLKGAMTGAAIVTCRDCATLTLLG